MFSTAYGHLLLVKLVLLGGVLVAARSSRAWVARRLDVLATSGDVAVLRPFVVSVAIEVALAAGVVAAASLLVATSPAH